MIALGIMLLVGFRRRRCRQYRITVPTELVQEITSPYKLLD